MTCNLKSQNPSTLHRTAYDEEHKMEAIGTGFSSVPKKTAHLGANPYVAKRNHGINLVRTVDPSAVFYRVVGPNKWPARSVSLVG